MTGKRYARKVPAPKREAAPATLLPAGAVALLAAALAVPAERRHFAIDAATAKIKQRYPHLYHQPKEAL